MTNTYFLAILLTALINGFVHASEIKRLDYEGFTVWVDCDRRGAVKFQYNAQHDTGSYLKPVETLFFGLVSFHINLKTNTAMNPETT